MSIRRAISTVLLSGSVVAAGLAQGSPALNVKLGLWEMAMDSATAGAAMPPGVDLSKLTPEQQAMMAQAMRGRGVTMGPGGVTIKTCLTKEGLASGQIKANRQGQDCKDKITKSTATTLDITETCTSNSQPPVVTTSQVHVEALSQTSVKITHTQEGQPATTMTGKWLAADCGDIK
jgi:uncharacterized cupredoxin-like copper-binding protein